MIRVVVSCMIFLGLLACDQAASTSEVVPETVETNEAMRGGLVVEFQKLTDSPITFHAYICAQCSQWGDLDPSEMQAKVDLFMGTDLPEDCSRGSQSVRVVQPAKIVSVVVAGGEQIDLFDDIPGAEFTHTATPTVYEFVLADGTVYEGFPPPEQPKAALVHVEHTRTFYWDAGDTIHEITDLAGNHYILFGLIYGADLEGLHESLDLPAGWVHSSRVLDEDLSVASDSLATVLVELGSRHIWQRYVVAD